MGKAKPIWKRERHDDRNFTHERVQKDERLPSDSSGSSRSDDEDDDSSSSSSVRGDAKREEKQKGETETAVEDDDENVPQTFAALGLREELVEACRKMGWPKPSKIQAQAIPYGLAGRDIIGLAETGSGKTGSFVLPILQALLDQPAAFFACVLAPTRELAVQIADQFNALGASISLKSAVIVGGMDMMSQSLALAKRPHVIIATPGRLVDHLTNTKGFSLRAVKYLVIDEADKLLNMDFEKELNTIIAAIPREGRRTYLFSATMTTKVAKLQRASLVDPVRVEVSTKYATVETLVQQYLFIPAKYKHTYLTYVLNACSGNSVIVFLASCANAARVSIMLNTLGFRTVALHGQMSQPKRLGALTKFKEKSCNILLATDVASRGLDIPAVDLVVNFDCPTNPKDYIHRVGRTARAGRSGRAVTIVTQYDVEMYQKIEHLVGKKFEKYPCEEQEVLVFHERVSESLRLATVKQREEETTHSRHRKNDGDDDGDDKPDRNRSGNAGKQGNRNKNDGKGNKDNRKQPYKKRK